MIYFVQAGHLPFVKVGYSANPSLRIYDLQGASPLPIIVHGIIEGTIADEKLAHQVLSRFRERNEWFDADPALDLLRKLKSAENIRERLRSLLAEERAAWLEKIPPRDLFLQTLSRTVAALLERHGSAKVAKAMGMDPASVRRCAKGAPTNLAAVFSLLNLDPRAFDALLALYGRTTESVEEDTVRGAA